MIVVKTYVTKPTQVEAVQITEENMEEVAKWCGGTIMTDEKDPDQIRFIKVRVFRYLNEKQTRGTVGDWILKKGLNSFKVYHDKAFHNNYTDDNNSIPLAKLEDVGTAIFDRLVAELSKDTVTKIRMGTHAQDIITPAPGVPMRPSELPE